LGILGLFSRSVWSDEPKKGTVVKKMIIPQAAERFKPYAFCTGCVKPRGRVSNHAVDTVMNWHIAMSCSRRNCGCELEGWSDHVIVWGDFDRFVVVTSLYFDGADEHI
jgi:hypothetical protein